MVWRERIQETFAEGGIRSLIEGLEIFQKRGA